MAKPRILLADDHALVLEGFRRILEGQYDLVGTVEDGRAIAVKGQESHPLNKGKICAKGQAMIEHLYHPERLKYPLKKVNGKSFAPGDRILFQGGATFSGSRMVASSAPAGTVMNAVAT